MGAESPPLGQRPVPGFMPLDGQFPHWINSKRGYTSMPAPGIWHYGNMISPICQVRHPSYLVHDAIRPLAYLLDLFVLRE